jgi:hypothetical protein
MKNMLTLLLLVVVPCLGWAQPSAGLVDPLRPSHYRPQPQPQPQVEVLLGPEQIDVLRQQLQLTAILKSADRAMAVINGRPLQVGQTVNDFRLNEIGSDYVILRKGDHRLTLYRIISGVKKSAAQN